MHAQRRTLASTIRYTALMLAGLVVSPLLVPQMAELGHFDPVHAATGCVVSLAMIFAATAAFHRSGFDSRLYRVLWVLETTAVNLTFLSLAFVAQGKAPWFWVLILIQVFLIALEGSFSLWPPILYSGGAVLAALGHLFVHHERAAAVWALLFGGSALVMCIELQRIGRRLSRMVVEREQLIHELVESRSGEERARIARDLHDGLASELTAMTWRVESIGKTVQEPAAQRAMSELVDRVRLSIDELRSIVWALRSPAQSWSEVVAYLRSRCTELCGGSLGFELEARDEAPEGQLVRGVERVALVRVTLEAVRNAARHSQGKQVKVTLHRADGLTVSIADDGRGLPANTEGRTGSGLANMKARVTALGGVWSLRTGSEGTVIQAVLPRGGDVDGRPS